MRGKIGLSKIVSAAPPRFRIADKVHSVIDEHLYPRTGIFYFISKLRESRPEIRNVYGHMSSFLRTATGVRLNGSSVASGGDASASLVSRNKIYPAAKAPPHLVTALTMSRRPTIYPSEYRVPLCAFTCSPCNAFSSLLSLLSSSD